MKYKNATKIILLVIIVISVFDIFDDYRMTGLNLHILIELVLTFLCLIVFIILSKNYFKLETDLVDTNIKLQETLQQALKHKMENENLHKGINDKIHKSFEIWGLSKSEIDVALLLLRGLSFKDIAQQRDSSEKTVRQHSLKIYEKSNLAGRAELSAYFIQELFKDVGQ